MITLELEDLFSGLTTLVETFDRHPVGTAMLIVVCAMGVCVRLARR